MFWIRRSFFGPQSERQGRDTVVEGITAKAWNRLMRLTKEQRLAPPTLKTGRNFSCSLSIFMPLFASWRWHAALPRMSDPSYVTAQ